MCLWNYGPCICDACDCALVCLVLFKGMVEIICAFGMFLLLVFLQSICEFGMPLKHCYYMYSCKHFCVSHVALGEDN